MKKLFIILVLTIEFVLYSFAQAPQFVNFQAIVRNTNDVAVQNSPISVRIALIPEIPEGTPVYTEKHLLTTDSRGLINLNIGNGTVLDGNFPAIDWAANQFFIEIALDDEGGDNFDILGTTQLLSVPYALYANKAATADNVAWDTGGSGIYYNGNVGIGTSNPNSKLEVRGDNELSVDTLFQVKDNAGNTVFAVFPDGVQVYVSEDAIVDQNKSGFVVNGRNATNVVSEYFRVTPDSVRIYLKDDGGKRTRRGSFAVGKRTTKRSFLYDDLLHVTPDSTRIYVSGETNAGFNVVDDRLRTPLLRLDSVNYFVGHYAGEKTVPLVDTEGQTRGYHNLFFGYGAGRNNILGAHNVFLGYEAGTNSTDNANVFIGYQSGKKNKTGGGSVLIGKSAGMNSNAQAVVAIGAEAGISNTTGVGNVFIGQASGLGYMQFMTSPDGGGGSPPPPPEHRNNLTGGLNTLLGVRSGQMIDGEASSNTLLGGLAGRFISTGSNNVFIGYGAGYKNNGSNTLCIDNDTLNTPLIYGEFDHKLVSIDNKLGIGTRTPAYSLDVVGSIRATGSVFYGGIPGMNNGMPYQKPDFVFKNDYKKRFSTSEVELFIKQNGHLPWLTPASSEKENAIDMTRMSFETLEAVENLQLQVIELKKENEALKNKYNDLEERLKKLEGK